MTTLTSVPHAGIFPNHARLTSRPVIHAAALHRIGSTLAAPEPESVMPKRALSPLLALFLACTLQGCVVLVTPRRSDPPPPPPPVSLAPQPCPAGYGWSPGYGCVPLPAAPPPAYVPVITRVKSAYLNLRSSPGTSSSIIATLTAGEEVQVLGYSDGWTRVYCPGRHMEGWLSGRHLSDY